MALSAFTVRRYRSGGFSFQQNWRIYNASVIYMGAFVGVPGSKASTTYRGYARPYTNEQTIEYVGVAIGANYESATDQTLNKVTGTSTAPYPEVRCEGGPVVLEQATVTGVSAQSDVGKPTYLSDDDTLTLTASQAPDTGRILYWYSSTTADVMMYGYLNNVADY